MTIETLGSPSQDLSTPQLPLTLKDLHLFCPRSLHCFSSPFRNTHDKVSPLSSTASSRVAPYELVRSTRRLAPASLPLQVSLAIGVLAGRPEPDASASVLEVVGPQSKRTHVCPGSGVALHLGPRFLLKYQDASALPPGPCLPLPFHGFLLPSPPS